MLGFDPTTYKKTTKSQSIAKVKLNPYALPPASLRRTMLHGEWLES